MKRQWTKEEIWTWYNEQPWIRGFNTFHAHCVNGIALWQTYNHKAVFEQVEREFALAQETGFNAIRLISCFDVWKAEHNAYLQHLEEYLTLADKYGLKALFLLGGDGLDTKKEYAPPALGEQPVDWGWHGGRGNSGFAIEHQGVAYSLLDEDENYREDFFAMIREMAHLYGQDPRVQAWDVWNEIGGGNRGMLSAPYMKRAFDILREEDVIQPLTACCFTWGDYDMTTEEVELLALSMSDIISIHCYQPYAQTVAILERIKEEYGRPILCTEWLHRIGNNNVEEIFPLFYLEKVGCYNWGLVQSYYQSHEPHACFWPLIADPHHQSDLKLHMWQHDLFRFNGLPYIAKEVALIKQFADRADKKWAAAHTND